ncbi:DUF4097 family beta strand repeat-containing protein [Virgibacillus sp. C22-A2]|uniref:DUF4097 family beta strand repeat-containing protein n=1 Tax=Virgibacillus tibetensis TaxID=3042313 RepID=A0ABU6KI96_9BACI|nr:DUF4097 family beta strand repeat-containing protein [Virgibacillus sp. C22-A2]
MSNVKKIALIAILLILVGGIGSILIFNLNEPVSVAEAKEIDSTTITAVEVQANNGKVEIMSAEGSTTRVELTGEGIKNNKEKLSVEQNGNTLFIQTVNQNNKLFNFNFFTGSVTLKVYLPEAVYETLHVAIDNGSLETQQVTIKNIDAVTKNGRITMDNITTDTLHVKSNNGKIVLDQVEGAITGKTDNGSISLTTKDLDRSIDFETDNGSIKIQTEQEPTNALFDVRVGNGKTSIFGSSNWDTLVGNGDNIIKLSTDNGSITVEDQTR